MATTVWMLLISFVGPMFSVSDSLPVVRKESTRFEHMWLEDFETLPLQDADEDEGMQADSPSLPGGSRPLSVEELEDMPRCPSPGTSMPVHLCASLAANCQSDADCGDAASGRQEKCCFDGCRRTCLVAVPPPIYIDWKREPQTRLASGRSWLIAGPDDEREVEWCSTSYDYSDPSDSEPLLCPHGYMCHIEEPGNDDTGIPNRGRCVRENGQLARDKDVFKMTAWTAGSDGQCIVEEKTYKNGDTFNYGRHTCKCEDSDVLCRVGRKLNLMSVTQTTVKPSRRTEFVRPYSS